VIDPIQRAALDLAIEVCDYWAKSLDATAPRAGGKTADVVFAAAALRNASAALRGVKIGIITRNGVTG
jgi:hypothetical protein